MKKEWFGGVVGSKKKKKALKEYFSSVKIIYSSLVLGLSHENYVWLKNLMMNTFVRKL